MNYYIQGDAANADKIKAAFERLGLIADGHNYDNDNCLYFTYDLEGGGKVISSTNINFVTASLIKRLAEFGDYQELELPVEPKFKVGDTISTGKVHTTILQLDMDKRGYRCSDEWFVYFKNQELWHLVGSQPKFKVGDVVLYYGGLYRVEDVLYTKKNGSFYNIGNLVRIPEIQLTLADHRDEIRILKGGEQ